MLEALKTEELKMISNMEGTTKRKPKIDSWSRNAQDAYIYPSDDKKCVRLNIEKFIPESSRKLLERNSTAIETLKTFTIGRAAFQNKTTDVCNYIDYFIENYDIDKELPVCYLSLKSIIDDGKYSLTDIEFQKLLYKRLFTGKIKRRIYKLVNDNYDIDVTVDAKNGRLYNTDDDFTNEDAKRFLAISMMLKIAIPPMEHYMATSAVYKESTTVDLAVDIFREIFYEVGGVTNLEMKLYAKNGTTTGDVLAYAREHDLNIDMEDLEDEREMVSDALMVKLYKFVVSRIGKHYNNNPILWTQQSALRGLTENSHSDRLLSKYIFYDNFFKFNFHDNLVSFLQSIVSTQLKYTIEITKYKKDPIRVDNVKGSEGLSSIDKLEQSMVKIDESQVVKTELAIVDVLKRLEKKYGKVSDDEIDYYANHHINLNTYRNYLLENKFAKEFGGFSELRSMPDRYYIKLTIIAKRMLKRDGYIQLPFLMSSVVKGKVSNRILQNTKYLTKLEQSGTFKHLMDDNYRSLKGYRDDMIIEDVSKILNNVYCYVEYETPEVTGEPIMFNEDIISDEYMNFIDNV